MSCNGSDKSCGGSGCGLCCGRTELLLCREELDILLSLGQYAFLPVIQGSREGEPYFSPLPADCAELPKNFSDLLFSLERKRLIQIDPDIPLVNADYGELLPQNRCGSISLTLQGQEALDWVEL